MRTKTKKIRQFLISTIGIFILACAISFISWKFKLVTNGLPGYALIINYTFGVSDALVLFLMNTVILSLCWAIAGKSNGLKAVYGYTLLSVLMVVLRGGFGLEQTPAESIEMKLGLIVLQAILATFGIAVVIANTYSFGSYSSTIPIVQKFFEITPPKIFLLYDIALMLLTLIVFGVERAFLLAINVITFFIFFNLFLKLFKKFS